MARQLESEVEVQADRLRRLSQLESLHRPGRRPGRPRQPARTADAPPGRRPTTFRPRVLEAEPARRLRWLGHLLVPGLFDGEHRFTIEPAGPGRARVTQQETFRGLLAPLLLAFIAGPTLEGFRQMNRALEARAEEPTPTQATP
jgi:hypothetical protein